MALTDVAPVLAKDFVIVRLDTDRMIDADKVLKRYNPKDGGIPWFAFLDGDGKAIADSNDSKEGNIGYPGEESTAAHFQRMLEKAAKRMTAAEIEALVKSAVAFKETKLPGT